MLKARKIYFLCWICVIVCDHLPCSSAALSFLYYTKFQQNAVLIFLFSIFVIIIALDVRSRLLLVDLYSLYYIILCAG